MGNNIAADLLGWIALAGGGLLTIAIAISFRQISMVLIAAFAFRASAALVHYYVMPLPDGGTDAVTFEKLAWEWGRSGLSRAFEYFPGASAYFYSWVMSLFYALTGRSLLMLQAFSVVGGTIVVLVGWQLAKTLWNRDAAYKAAWVLALFPTLVLYSALPMREVWVVLLFLFGLIGVVSWARRGGLLSVLGGNAAFVGASFFHGALFVAVLGFLGLIIVRTAGVWSASLSKGRVRVVASLVLLSMTLIIGSYFTSGIALPKLGTPEQVMDMSRLIDRTIYFSTLEHAEARYPEWTVPSAPIDLIWAVPLRSAYLLFSPFPWDLANTRHVIGLIDGLLYVVLGFFAWRNRQAIRAEAGARAVFLLLIPLIVAFGIGTGNFGTALRHRAKFVAALVVLAAPRLPRLSARNRQIR